MTKEEAKKFGLQLLHGIMERNGSYPVYANNVKQAIEALSEPDGSSETPKDLEEAAWKLYPYEEGCDVDLPYPSTYDENEGQRKAFIAGAKWQKEQMTKELSEKIASAYQLGLADKEKQMMDEWLKDRDGCFWDGVEEGKKAMREKMMKEAVEGEVVTTNKYTSVRYLSRYGTFRYFYGIGGGFQKGDKVRIIIVKED